MNDICRYVEAIQHEWQSTYLLTTPFSEYLKVRYGIELRHRFHPRNKYSYQVVDDQRFLMAQLKFGG